jgi:hypothetical protein
MSEEAPQMVEADSGRQVPVRYEGEAFTQTDAEGKSLLTGEDISPGSDLVGKNYIHDPAIAQERALNEHTERSTSANLNSLATEVENFEVGQNETRDVAAQRFEDKIIDNPAYDNRIKTPRGAELAGGVAQDAAMDPESRDQNLQRLRTAAEALDAKAQELGDWSEVLLKHMPSRDFMEAHPDIRFTPSALREYARDARSEARNADWYQARGLEIGGLEVFQGVDHANNSGIRLLMETVAENLDELDTLKKKLNTISTNPEATMKDVTDFYRELLKKGKIDPLLESAREKEEILEQIRSGNAANFKADMEATVEVAAT